jgi:hypothetical protein
LDRSQGVGGDLADLCGQVFGAGQHAIRFSGLPGQVRVAGFDDGDVVRCGGAV